jgi:hypothetical protein
MPIIRSPSTCHCSLWFPCECGCGRVLSNTILRLIVASCWVFYVRDWRCTEPQSLKSYFFFWNCALFSLVLYNPQWTVMEKYTHYLPPQHNTLKIKTYINFPNNYISILTRNSCNSGQKQTDVNSFALKVHFAKTFICTIVNMNIYHRHISSVRNITLTSCCSGVIITGNIHYCSDFEVVQSSQIFCRNAEY